jgi:hypothetical protein
VKITLRKLSDQRHTLEVGSERVECETRSYLVHDFLHFAVESAAGIAHGFWGSLAAGRSLAELNDRTAPMSPAMAPVERLVGALSSVMGDTPAHELAARIVEYEQQLGGEPPAWLTPAFIDDVRERMRRLLGQWRATRFGDAMELTW